MKALVIGCASFAGRHMARRLLAEGLEVSGAARTPLSDLPSSVRLFQADVRDRKSILRLVANAKPDYVCSFAGVTEVATSIEDPVLAFDVNVGGALNVFEAVRQSVPSARVLNVSSAHVYGSLEAGAPPFSEDAPLKPGTPYTTTKILAEHLSQTYTKTFGVQVITVRPFTHIGPGQNERFACSEFARQVALIRKGMAPAVLRVGSLDAHRDFTDVRDVVEAYWRVLARGEAGEVYNVCTGEMHSMGEVVQMLREISGIEMRIERDVGRLRAVDDYRLCGDPSRIKRQLDWRPRIGLRQTLSDLVEFWCEKLTTDATTRA